MIGHIRFLELTRKFKKAGVPEILISSQLPLRKFGHLPRTIQVKTAGVLRLPHTTELVDFSEDARLEFQTLCDIVERHIASEEEQNGKSHSLEENLASVALIDLTKLVDKVIALMGRNGVDVTNISGGIDYTLPVIRELLGVFEISFPGLDQSVESGVYKGLPANALKKYLEHCAWQARN